MLTSLIRFGLVLGLGGTVALSGGCESTQVTKQVTTLGGLLADPDLQTGEADTSATGFTLNPLKWGEDKEREVSVQTAKTDWSDPVGTEMVQQNKDMYWGPRYGNTWFSANDYLLRQKKVDERAGVKLTARDSHDQAIAALSDKIVKKERDGFNAKLAELRGLKTDKIATQQKIDAQIAWVTLRLADLEKVPAASTDDLLQIAYTKPKEGDKSLTSAK